MKFARKLLYLNKQYYYEQCLLLWNNISVSSQTRSHVVCVKTENDSHRSHISASYYEDNDAAVYKSFNIPERKIVKHSYMK